MQSGEAEAQLHFHNGQNVKTIQMSINPRLHTQNVWYEMEYYSAMKRNEALIQAIPWMKPESIMSSKRSQTQKVMGCIISFVQMSRIGDSAKRESGSIIARGWGWESWIGKRPVKNTGDLGEGRDYEMIRIAEWAGNSDDGSTLLWIKVTKLYAFK
jgi:hypothetical protein